MAATTLVLGIGNVLLGDEGVGAAVVRRLREGAAPADETLCCLDGGTLSFTLAEPIGAAARLIVVDAAAMDTAPGTVRVFEDAAMDRQLRRRSASVHEVSLADLLDMARLTDSLPARRALIGIEPAHIDWDDALSPPVAAAVPVAIAEVRALIARWQKRGQSPF
jgi:hydrogenase maturation protease